MRILIAALGLMVSLAACAESDQPESIYKAGQHYAVLDQPVRTIDSSKIEVTEVFWYGCSHCFRFEPMLHQWKKKQTSDVLVRQSPAMWNKDMEIHARAFYTAKALNALDKVNQPLFNGLNVEKKRLNTEDELAKVFVAAGVDEDKFHKTFNSFGVTSQVKQADARARSYKVTGTPEIVVDGKYRVSARMAGGQSQMLDVVDTLVEQIRAKRK
jgi:thiol:disulfide interchange protein DsbA